MHVFGKMVTFDTLKNLKRLLGFGFKFLDEPFPPEVANVLPSLGELLLALQRVLALLEHVVERILPYISIYVHSVREVVMRPERLFECYDDPDAKVCVFHLLGPGRAVNLDAASLLLEEDGLAEGFVA